MSARRTYSKSILGAISIFLVGAVPAFAQKPQQVVVSVKIIEFQATKGVETGLSAYFAKVARPQPFGRVDSTGPGITSADLTFPTNTAAGITVFLDRISLSDGEIEMVLQALVDENRAFILSRPHAMVKVNEEAPTIIETTQKIPYPTTRVVGSTAVQITAFEDTGVKLEIKVPEVIDDDGNWSTTEDTYIHLDVNAFVKEEGQRIVVALEDQLTTGNDFATGQNALLVPEFVSRSIDTEVWVRQGQVLMLGGLYRNSDTKNISTVPLLSQAEDALVGVAQNVVAGAANATPLTGTIGSRDSEKSRRELVFLIKAETWRPAFTISDDLGLQQQSQTQKRRTPGDIITSVTQGVADLLTGQNKNGRDKNESADSKASEGDKEQ